MATDQPTTRLGYIPAVDGLRAVAVVSVMLFHLWPQLLPGGFTGVDIFFVISGFVVTGSMLGRRFDSLGALLAWFYARRLMRIMPALVAMLLAAIVAANLFIPDAWLSRALAEAGIAAFFGLSNVALAVDADTYFGPQAAYNPFTHTWSLGVEEQFYLLFPFLIHWHARRGQVSERHMLLLVAGLTLGSLAVAAALSGQAHGFAFYLIFPRFWELGVGMLLCLTIARWQPLLAKSGGTALVLASLALVAAGFAIPESRWFPFPLALLPVLGTAGLIASVCAFPASRLTRLLETRPMVTVGRLSYSLYLWHWPVFVLFRWTCGFDTLPLQLAALAIGCALATASFHLIEQPLRSSPRIAAMPRARVVRRALAAVLVSALAGTALFVLHDRVTLSVTRDHAAWYAESGASTGGRCPATMDVERFHGGKVTNWMPGGCGRPEFTVFAVGDSHNLAYAPDYARLAAEHDVWIEAYFRSGCPFVKLNDAVAANGRCGAYEAALIARIAERARPGDVIFLPGLRLTRLTNQFEHDGAIAGGGPATVSAESFAAAKAMVARLAATGARVVFEAPKPLFRSPPFRCADWFNRGNPICRGGLTMARSELEARRAPVLAAMARLAAEQPDVTVWDPFPLLCPGTTCEAVPGGVPLFFDGDHLSGAGNARVYPGLRDAILGAAGR